MMKKYFVVLVPVIFFLAYLLTSKLSVSSSSRQIENVTPTAAVSPIPSQQPTFNSDEDYYQYFLMTRGLAVTQPTFENLTGRDKQAVFIAIGEGCGSCHYNEIHIFDGREEIFTFYGEDTQLNPIDGKGFTITQPLLKDGQPYSERDEFQSATYVWSDNKFVRTKVSPNWVDTPQTPG